MAKSKSVLDGLVDYAQTLGAGVQRLGAGAAQFGANAQEALVGGEATTLRGIAQDLAAAADARAADVTPEFAEAKRRSTPRGNLFRPDGQIDRGEHPSLGGVAANVLESVPSAAASAAAALATRGLGAKAQAAVGAGTNVVLAGGAAAQEEEARTRGQSEAELANVAAYREGIAAGLTPDAAREAAARAAGRGALLGTALPAALGGAATGLLIGRPGQRALGRVVGDSRTARALGTGVVGAAEEGVQEVAEGVGQNIGAGLAAGETREAGENSFGNLVLGAAAGGPIAGGAAAMQRPDTPPPGVAPAPKETIAATPPPPPSVIQPERGLISRAAAAGVRDGAVQGAQVEFLGSMAPADGGRAEPEFDVAPEQRIAALQQGPDVALPPYQSPDGRIVIEPYPNLGPVEREIEARSAAAVTGDLDAMIAKYEALPGTEGGRIISADEAREVFPEYSAGPEGRSAYAVAVHEPSSYLAKAVWSKRLAEPVQPDKAPLVVFTAGGTGAGKTSAVRRDPAAQKVAEEADLTFDGNLQNVTSASQKINEAIESGRAVSILYVNRDPVEAFKHGVIPRAQKDTYGRTVPVQAHVGTHIRAANAIIELSKMYAGNPLVDIRILNNSSTGGKNGVGTIEDVAQIASMDYNALDGAIRNVLEEERAAGALKPRVANYYFPGASQPGAAEGVQPAAVDGRAGQPGAEASAGTQQDLTPAPVAAPVTTISRARAAGEPSQLAAVAQQAQALRAQTDAATLATPAGASDATPLAAATAGLPDAGSVRGGAGLLVQPRRPLERDARREADGSLAGLPRLVGGFSASVHAPAAEVANAYMASRGERYTPPAEYARVDKARARRIADAFEQMPHAPADPEVAAAYDAMINETIAQYEAVLASGLTVEFISGADPYAGNPRAMTEDVRNNNHMWVFSTREGFGSNAEFDPIDNPLLRETPFQISGQPALANDLFRVVHDYFGHVKEGVGFRADGEENAWRAHSAMYSPLARRAMTTETRGQNSWLNFGPHGDRNRTAKVADTIFADQKIGLLPQWVMVEGAGQDFALGRKEPDATPAQIIGRRKRYLTSDEFKKLRRDTAQKLVTLLQQLPSADEMANVALAGQAKRGWYKNSADALVDVFGHDAPRFAALLAALSPQTSVENNLFNALSTWKNWVAAGRPTEKAQIVKIMGRSVMGGGTEASVLGAWINNAERALAAEDPSAITLSGPKVNSFMLNLRGVVEEVTNDAWMANYALVDQTLFSGSLTKGGDPGKGPGYLAMSARAREAAEKLTKLTGETWSPAEVQETVWSWAKTTYELADSAGETRSAVELIRDGAVTDELIGATPAFGELFHVERYRSILESAGLRGPARIADGRPASGTAGDPTQAARPDPRALEKAAGRLDRLRQQRRAPEVAPAGVDRRSRFDPPPSVQHSRIYGAMDGDERAATTAALARLQRMGYPKAWIERVPSFFTHNNTESFSARFYLYGDLKGAVSVRANVAGDKDGLFRALAHEMAHAADYDPEVEGFASDASPRFATSVAADGSTVYTGDVVQELHAAWQNDTPLATELAYPFDPAQGYDASTIKVEAFAQATMLYFTERDALKTYAPKTYALIKEILNAESAGDAQGGAGAQGSAEAVSRALRSTGARKFAARAVGAGADPRGEPLDRNEGSGPEAQGRGLGSGDQAVASQAARGNTYFSALSRSVTAAQGAPKRAGALVWRQWLDGAQRRGEFRQEERDWLGVDEWLVGQGDVTREQLAEFVRANEVQVGEVVLGGEPRGEVGDDGYVYNTTPDAKFANYVLPGGRDYKELLLTLPRKTDEQFKAEWKKRNGVNIDDSTPEMIARLRQKAEGIGTDDYRSSHFDTPNIIAHVRFNTRTDADGKAVLFIEEIQSDWHQKGRKEGYGSVPDAPFKTTWPMLAFKRMVRWAAENGFDRIAWTTGEQQAARYDLSKLISNIDYNEARGGLLNAYAKDGPESDIIAKRGVKPEELAEIIGKDVAEKLLAVTPDEEGFRTLKNTDLKVGGEGMKAFYDKLLPNEVNKLAKRFGGKVGTTTINDLMNTKGVPHHSTYLDVHSLDLTPAMRDTALAGQALFYKAPEERGVNSMAPPPAQAFDGFTLPSEALRDHLSTAAGQRLAGYKAAAAVGSDKLRLLFQDYFLPVRRVQEAITARGGAIDEASDVYGREELYYGRTGDQLQKLEDEHVKPLVAELQRAGVTQEDAELYLYAKFAPKRNARIAAINEKFPDGGSGMTNSDAAQVLADFERAGLTAKLESIAARVRRLNDVRLKALEEGGLLSAEEAQLWREEPDYVPLKGFHEDVDTPTRPPTGQGFSIGGREAHRALGRASRASDILANAIAQTEQAIIRAEKNRVAQSLLRLAKANPNDALWTVDLAPQKAQLTPSGEVSYRTDNLHRLADNVVSVKVDGEQHFVTLKEKRLAEAMKNLGSAKTGALLRGFASVNRFLSLTRTMLAPEFVLANFARDIQTALINLSDSSVATTRQRTGDSVVTRSHNLATQTLSGVKSAMAAMWRHNRGTAAEGEWDTMAAQFAADGGLTAFVGQRTVEEQQAKIESLLSEARGGKKAAAKKLVRTTFEFIEDLNGAVENATRLSAYKAALDAGMTRDAAARLAKNLTVNFNRKGQLGPVANSLYLFYNASVQGSHRFLRAMKSPRVRQIMGATAAFGYGLAAMNRAVGGEDDDGEDKWDKIPEWEKARNLIILLPGGSGKMIKIPLPYSYNIPYLIGSEMESAVNSKKPASSSALNVVEAILSSFNPVGDVDFEADSAQTIGKMIAPTAVDPALDIAFNRNFFGAPINPENSPFDKVPEPDSQMAFPSTSPIAVGLAELLNTATGGDALRPGAIDISPGSMVYVFDYLTGGTGGFVERAATAVTLAAKGEEVPLRTIPFLRVGLSELSDRRVTDTYFRVRDDVELRAEMTRLPGEYDAEELAFAAPGRRLEPLLKVTDRQLSVLRKQRKAAKAAGNDERVKAIEAQQRALQLRFNTQYFKAISED
jgi:hypothetical protein